MQFRKIQLRNFRAYKGEHDLEFMAPGDGKNVHLIGGLNGAGKTSLFLGIVLGLYGMDSVDLAFKRPQRTSLREAYRQFLEESFSFGALIDGQYEMSIRLTLDHNETHLQISRMWWFDDNGNLVDESLVIYDGVKPLFVEAASEDERHSILREYIESIAPARVGKFFFFDGEEIRSIASRDPDKALVEGLNQLLGFEPLLQLTKDLRVLRTEIVKELPSSSRARFQEASESLDAARQSLNTLRDAISEGEQASENLELQLSSIDDELEGIFGDRGIQSRSDALDSLAKRQRELASVSAEIQSFVADVLTLTLPGPLLERSIARVNIERSGRASDGETARIMKFAPTIEERVISLLAEDLAGDRHHEQLVRKTVKATFQELIDDSENRRIPAIFAMFSTEELARVPLFALSARDTARREFRARLVRRNHLQEEISRLQRINAQFLSGDVAQQLLQRKSSILEAKLTNDAELKRTRLEEQSLIRELSIAEAGMTKLENELRASESINSELDLLRRIDAAITEFAENLRSERADSLASTTTEMIRRLAHKEDLIARVEIDPETFHIQLSDRAGDEVKDLSAGEREIFALSLVWALARVSNRNLPVIIDTPLGRLDQMHRSSVVSEFIPRAGEQVIVLATDSEIDERWYRLLKPYIVDETVIAYCPETRSSKFEPGVYLELRPLGERVD